MPAPASICFPTRRRREYLAVALASVAPQAAAHGAELVIVEEAAGDRATAARGGRPGAGGAGGPLRGALPRAGRGARDQRGAQRRSRRLGGSARLPARRRRRRV